MKALRRALRPAAAEFAGNARLRWGGWLILATLLVYCILVQSDRLAAARADYAGESERLARAEALLRQRDWPERLAAEREAHRQIRSTFWQAETEGLAQAKLQAALTAIIEDLRLRKPRMRSGTSQPLPDLPEVWRVQTRLDAAYRPGVELRLLHALATHPEKLVVDRLDLVRRKRRNDSRMSLILSAYFVGVTEEEG